MTMIDKEFQDITAKMTSKKNLRKSLISLGLFILSGPIFFFAADSFYLGHSDIVSWTLIILFYGLMLLSAILAVLTVVNSFITLKTTKDSKNYIAIGISILVLLAVAKEILQQL